MIIIDNIPELELMGVFDRGIPYQERVVLHAHESVNLGRFGLLLGVEAGAEAMLPFRDNFFWFGSMDVDRGHRIFVYTCDGSFRATTVKDTTIPALVFHWQRPNTVFAPSITVGLVRFGGLVVGKSKPPELDANFAEFLKLMDKQSKT